jgi:hypothetical protein
MAVLAGGLVAGAATYVAARHNPQGEFNGADGHLSAVLLFQNVFALWFVCIGGLVLLWGLVLWRLARK